MEHFVLLYFLPTIAFLAVPLVRVCVWGEVLALRLVMCTFKSAQSTCK